MKSEGKYKTEQESFWAGQFGAEYIDRNKGDLLLAANLNFFTQALKQAGQISSCLEFGANIGMNLRALKLLYPNMQLEGIEINPDTAKELASWLGEGNVFNGSILDWSATKQVELSLIKGVLIHINPEVLGDIYEKLYAASSKFILVCEYYNSSPVAISYRGHTDRLFKRDFAGEMLDRFKDLRLVDYGFSYHRDVAFPQDDISWFLLEKR